MTDRCLYLLFPARHDPPEPAEYCERDALDGLDYCEYHREDFDE